MSRRRPPDRIEQLVDCAARVFTERGYRRTQMADVARALGVAPGTLYLYVASKEALFDLVVQRAFVDRPEAAPKLPLPTPAPGATLRRLQRRIAREAQLPALRRARQRAAAEVDDELRAIVAELYDMIARRRHGIRLLERSVLDWPELAALYHSAVRLPLFAELAAYLRRRSRQGRLRELPHPDIAARMIVESVAWFALHRHGDPTAEGIDDRAAAATIADIVARGLLPR